MKKIIYAFSALALLFASCSSDGDSSTDSSSTSSILPKRVIETDPIDGSYTTYYTYNGNKLVSHTDSDGGSATLTYTGDLITSWKYDYEDDGILDQEDTYSYDANGRVIEFVREEPLQEWGNRETYTYNGDGTVSVNYYTGDHLSQTNLSHTGKIFFTNGEVSKIEKYYTGMSGDYTNTSLYTYDVKNSAFKNIIGLDKIAFTDGEAEGAVHNILTLTRTTTSSSEMDSFTHALTYDGNNFPTSDIETDADDVETMSVQYFYE